LLTRTTARSRRTGNDPIVMAVFATTPPHINATNSTLAKGVHLEIQLHNFGMYSFSITPRVTGANTTFAHATHNALPLTGTALPTMNFVNNGVTAEANTVLHVVSSTLSATSAPAISVTRFDAVPPGLHPTSTKPKNKCCPPGPEWDSNIVRPIRKAESGIKTNWHNTPTGIERRWVRDVKMFVKSDRSSVIPVPSITLESTQKWSCYYLQRQCKSSYYSMQECTSRHLPSQHSRHPIAIIHPIQCMGSE
jgi:hypothetical protein